MTWQCGIWALIRPVRNSARTAYHVSRTKFHMWKDLCWIEHIEDSKIKEVRQLTNIGLTKFMRNHFYAIVVLRNKGLSFLQIADALPDMPKPRAQEKNLEDCYRYAFKRVRKSFEDIHIINIGNQGIAPFVRDSFDKIVSLRASGFSWPEIVSKFNLKYRFPLPKDLIKVVRTAFYRISQERLNHVWTLHRRCPYRGFLFCLRLLNRQIEVVSL